MKSYKFARIFIIAALLLAGFLAMPSETYAQFKIVPYPTGKGACQQIPECKGGVGKCFCSSGYCSTTENGKAIPFTRSGALNPVSVECDYNLCDMLKIMTNIARIIFGGVGGLTLLFFVYGSVQLIVSAGSSEKVAKGKKIMTDAVIGLVVVLLAYEIIGILLSTALGFGKGGKGEFKGGLISGINTWGAFTGTCEESSLAVPPDKTKEEAPAAAPAPAPAPAPAK